MVELNSTVEVEDPAEALRNQDGIFEVISPYGQVFQVTCRRGSRMGIREVGESENTAVPEPRRWRIQKLRRPLT
jgi:hypothetical protein